jgi:imidazolonepropionase-like amidohydrolase
MIRNTALAVTLVLVAGACNAETLAYTVVEGDKPVGHLTVDIQGDRQSVDFNVKNNGRGPTIAESLVVGADGLPSEWKITGATTFGSKVDEQFSQSAGLARWTDSTGPGQTAIKAPALYTPQSGSPWAEQFYLKALLKAPGQELAVLPGGTLKLEKGESLSVQGAGGPLTVTRYTLTGLDLQPTTLLVDDRGGLFADVSPSGIVVRKGYEGEEVRLRALAANWATQRFVQIEKQAAHRYDGPVRIRNVRVFDPKTSTLSAPESVLVSGRNIAAVEALDSPGTPGEVTIDGAGGTLIAGLFEMHAHLSQDDALLNLLAGVTTVRDMGNDNAVLDKLIERIDSGEIGGPHVIRSGFIEGKSPFNAQNGIVVDNPQAAIDAVRWYGARGYWQIKIYNSMNPDWVPAMAAEAHRLGMRVAGHVPAFSTADAMMAAGYDEMTHINQYMIGWVIQPGEDTRTLFRLTVLKRFPGIDLSSAKVRRTVDYMAAHQIAIDPTLGIHENLTLNRDGQIPPGAKDYFEHMPIGWRRDAMKGWIDVSAPGDEALYRGAFDKILETVRLLHDRGIFIVFGTDTGGAFTYHRELELYQRAGFSPPEILKRATYETARYVGQDQTLGSIEKGKRADFFLVPGDPTKDLKAIKTISLVAKDGVFYYPTEIYPRFGIRPFTPAPRVETPAKP